MGRTFSVFIGLLLLSEFAFSQIKLDVEIAEFKNNTGNVMFQIFDKNEKVIIQEIGILKEKKCRFSVQLPEPGKFAIRYYHDENLNGNMETNLVGKPTEGYGFSNNVIGKFGPPPFKDWLFDVTKDTKLSLKPTY